MTIPLETYDPDWENKWEAVHGELQKHNAAPYEEKDHAHGEQLLDRLHAAFHAQFRTTGDYAEWTERNIRQFAENEGMSDFKPPSISKESSVEATRRLYMLAVDKVKIIARADRNTLTLEQPDQGEPFSTNLGEGDTRTIRVMPLGYNMPVFDENELVGSEPAHASHSYVMEKVRDKVNICFFQVSNEGPSPINAIENLATQLYQTEFGAAAIARGEKYYSPGSINFYIYIPPFVYGDEKFMRVPLSWDDKSLNYFDPSWDHRGTVPYILRKYAAADGLAKDPDAPIKPSGRGARGKFPGNENE